MSASDIKGHRELQKASPRSGKEAGSRQLAELARQFAVIGAGAMQGKRAIIRHTLVNGGQWLNKRKILDS
jgi:hypothetical protein